MQQNCPTAIVYLPTVFGSANLDLHVYEHPTGVNPQDSWPFLTEQAMFNGSCKLPFQHTGHYQYQCPSLASRSSEETIIGHRWTCV